LKYSLDAENTKRSKKSQALGMTKERAITLEPSPLPLSSRAKRSVVERSAVSFR
jgi:hypothetical protein